MNLKKSSAFLSFYYKKLNEIRVFRWCVALLSCLAWIVDSLFLGFVLFMGVCLLGAPLMYIFADEMTEEVNQSLFFMVLILYTFVPIVIAFFFSYWFKFFKHIEQVLWLIAFILIPYLYTQIPSVKAFYSQSEVEYAESK